MRSGSWTGPGILALGLLTAGTALAQGDPSFDYSYEEPVYQDVMEDIRSLGLENDQSDNARCVNNPRSFSPPPCPEAVKLYEDFIEAQGIEDNHLAGRMFNSYIDGDHRNGDRLYARLKGYKLPRYKGPGEMIAGLGLRRPMGKRGEDCEFNPNAPLPCPGTLRAFQAFAEKHGLELTRETGQMFSDYAEGRHLLADVAYAQTKGLPIPDDIANRLRGPALDVLAMGLRRPMGKRGEDCEFNYYAVLPCPGVVRAWQEFAEKHGLELNEQTAEIFEAYAERDIEAGDVLLAEVKGVTVAELRGTPPKEEDPPRLLVRIRPSKD